jgi:hypothetical protein
LIHPLAPCPTEPAIVGGVAERLVIKARSLRLDSRIAS